MRLARYMAAVSAAVLLGLAGCCAAPLTPAQLTAAGNAVEQEVRQFAAAVARDITQQGPAAWEKHCAAGPAFFMACQGKLVFPQPQPAPQPIAALKRTVQKI